VKSRRIFDTGDFVLIDNSTFRGPAQIQMVRSESGHDNLPILVVDVLQANGSVVVYPMQAIARWNKDKLAFVFTPPPTEPPAKTLPPPPKSAKSIGFLATVH
jgi:hypothetical protein